MQEGATFRTVSRGGVQLVILAAVAAIGVSVGRWVVPEASSSTKSTAPAAAIDVRDPWMVDGPAAVDPALYQQEASASLIERKLAQLDRLDAWAVDGPAAVDPAIYMPTANQQDAIERKFAQMDAEDALSLDGPAADLPALNGGGSLIERKFAQMDAEDAR